MQNLIHKTIGLMSGTSMDGLDIAFCVFEKGENDKWKWEIRKAETRRYPSEMLAKLKEAVRLSSLDLHLIDVELGRWIGNTVKEFIDHYALDVDFIASHGHTVFHLPEKQLTLQIGNPNFIHAISQLPVISDFRSLDIAKGGQGAPLVPVGDALLFSEYEFCINLGGIANLSFQKSEKERVAYDICVCNILLNTLANHRKLEYDDKGLLAKSGQIIDSLLAEWNSFPFLAQEYPKSLGIEMIEPAILAKIDHAQYALEDMLATAIEHISFQISRALVSAKKEGTVLLTGGGAFNDFLIEKIQAKLPQSMNLIVADEQLVNYKEALIFAFLGVLNTNKEFNTWSSVTGAQSNSVSGQKLGDI